MKIIHHNDLDGQCGAAVIYWHHKGQLMPFHEQYVEPICIETSYGNILPWDSIEKGEKVYIVDYSLKPPAMEKLMSITEDITWIDHHKTAAEYVYSKQVKGLVDASNNYAGCELAWQYLHDVDPQPFAVSFVGDIDKWAWKLSDSEHFYEGARLFKLYDPTNPTWEVLLMDDDHALDMTQEVIKAGETCLEYRKIILEQYFKDYGFECEFEGLNCLAVGMRSFGSKAFGDLYDNGEYDAYITFEYDGAKWIYTLNSQTVDVSEIAKRYGGGGHKSSSGFTHGAMLLTRKGLIYYM